MALEMQPQQISSVTVSELQTLGFSELTLTEKVSIKIRGRPLPSIKIFQEGVSNNKKYIRSFNTEWYQRKSWLCGCKMRNALFCFPCMLFGGDPKWTKEGFVNLNRIKEKTEKHETSRIHIQNAISLSLLGTTDNQQKLSEACSISITEHNKKVAKNREILSKIIDCLLFCGNFEIPLSGHDEKDDSANPGLFSGLVNFASKLDPDLKHHLETSIVFKDVFKAIQNEILDCLFQIYQNEITKDIEKASFVAVMADDTTDVSEHTQMVIVFRYLLNDEIFECFWGFFIPDNQTADSLSKCILEQLNTILQGDKQKLIAQIFDGANVMKGKKGDVQAKIKEFYNNAHFTHCYAHQLNLIIKNAASITLNSRIFFSNIMAISTFFSRSPQHTIILHKHINATIPCPSTTSWNFNIHIVSKVYENVQPLKSCLAEIQSTSNEDQTVSEATGILHFLDNGKFMFWLELFYQIIPHVEIIYNQMQSREVDVFKIHEYIVNFETAILAIKNSMYCENPLMTLTAESKEVCDYICVDMKERYSFITHLAAAKLFNKDNLANFKKKLPTEEIKWITKAYPMINKEKLETELKVFYRRHDMHDYCKLMDLLKFITENNLDGVLREITVLIKILLTIPMTTSEPERCFSTIKRIKTFLKNTKNQDRLNAVAMISTQKNFFNSRTNIKEKAINLFATNKFRSMDFTFK